jgi:hypothetical protein
MHHKAPLPADSGDSAQTGKTSSPFEEQQQQWWGGHPHHPLPGAHGGLHTLEGAGSLSSRPHMNALAAKLAIREALAPLSAAELASVQEQLRLSRLARQAAPLTMVGSSSWGMPCEEGSGDAWQLAGAAASSAMTASCSTGGAGLRAAASLPSLPSPSSSSLSSAATGSFGGVVQQVAAALSAGTVAQADVQRVLSSLDPSVLQPAPGAQHVALAQAYQEEYDDYHMHCAQQQQQAAAAAAWRQQPAHGCFPPRQHSCALPITASCATSPGALTAAALSGLQHATQGGSAAAAGAGCADRSRHPGVSPARGRRSSCSGGSSRQARTSPWAPRVLAVSSAAAAAPRQRRPPQAATHGAAAMAVVEQSPWQPSTAGAPSPYGLQARLARLPPAVQAELLAQLEELDAVAEDMRRAAVGGDAGSAEPLGGPRVSAGLLVPQCRMAGWWRGQVGGACTAAVAVTCMWLTPACRSAPAAALAPATHIPAERPRPPPT